MLKNKTTLFKIMAVVFISIVTLAISPFIGIRWISLADLLNREEYRYIFFSIRIPRTLTAFLAGGGLAVSGMVFQALFRNPLASPYTLGVSGGASLGAAICIAAGAGTTLFGLSIVSAGAFTGAVLSMLFVYAFAWSKESNSTTLLLAGVIIATICSGLIMFIHQISPFEHAFQIMRWTMGGVDGTNYSLFFVMFIPLVLYFLIVAILLPQLDLFLTGDEIAHSRGINVNASRNLLIIATALAVGAIVSICGPIGFVGIIAPHACRMLFPGVRHRLLAFSSCLVGGTFLTLSDTIARTIIPPSEIPVGIITALFGGPFFLAVLIKRKNHLLM